jgi:hypothetical protein
MMARMFFPRGIAAQKGCVTRFVIVLQNPMSLPLVAQLPQKCIAPPLQNLHVEMTTNPLSRWHKIMVHKTVDAKEFRFLSIFTTWM